MKFWLSLVTVREIEQLPTLAKLAEQLGFHGLMIGDHLAMPAKIESRYPYSPDGKLFVPLDTPWPDPWITFAHLAAHTQKLEFASNIYLAALRDPFAGRRFDLAVPRRLVIRRAHEASHSAPAAVAR